MAYTTEGRLADLIRADDGDLARRRLRRRSPLAAPVPAADQRPDHFLPREASGEVQVVVAWPSPDLGEEIAAYAVVASDVEEAVLLDHCRTHLAPYKVPRAVLFIEELPRSSVGKVRKDELVRALPDLPAKSA